MAWRGRLVFALGFLSCATACGESTSTHGESGKGGTGALGGTMMSGGGGSGGGSGNGGLGNGGASSGGSAGSGMGGASGAATGGAGGEPGDVPRGVTLSAFAHHTCAIGLDGRVWCWGTRSQVLVCAPNCITEPPHAVSGLENAVEVALGYVHGCVLRSDASVVCWGGNNIGQAGPPRDSDPDHAPQPVPLEKETRHIGAGSEFTCAVAVDGSTTCWGATPTYHARGGGNGDPELVENLGPAAFVSGAVEHACALLETGEIECWGLSRWGKLGTGTPTSPMSFSPIHVAGLSGVTLLDSAPNRNYVLSGIGDPTCWGRNLAGPPVDPGDEGHPDPMPFPVGFPLTRVTLGTYHACGLREDERVVCWGMNSSGQLGTGDLDEHEGAVEVEGLSDVVEISAGADHTCARTRGNEIWCWGSNANRQLGVDGTTESSVPIRIDVAL